MVLPAGRRLPDALGWALCLGLGLGLGHLCRFPLVWSWLSGRALAWQAGWASIDPTLVDDGVGVVVVFAAVLWLLFAVLAVPSGALARRATRLDRRRWWWASAVAWVLPFAVLDVPGLIG